MVQNFYVNQCLWIVFAGLFSYLISYNCKKSISSKIIPVHEDIKDISRGNVDHLNKVLIWIILSLDKQMDVLHVLYYLCTSCK